MVGKKKLPNVLPPKVPEPVPAAFWMTEAGNEPVRDWLRSLDKTERVEIGDHLRTLQFAWPVGMPLNRPLGKGLHELRVTLPTAKIARLIFTHYNGTLVILHGFIKKDQKTPKSDLELARKRKKDLESAS
ncbi:MAG: type II toxin-antitoxin system RelE/ParE family toxin [Hyphomicrobiaceae bacterium]